MATLRLFAAAREAAGTGRVEIDATTVGGLLDEAHARFGASFRAVVDTSRVWLNGEPAHRAQPVSSTDEVAVLPPVSGG